jgi:hypothetical protein
MRKLKQREGDNGLSAVRVLDQYVLGTHNFREIPLNNLVVDADYQRDLNENAIQRIVNSFDQNKFEPPTVNERSKTVFALVDGMHRFEVAKRLKMPTITCRVVKVDHATEAKLFVELNRNRIWVTPVARFKAEIASSNPAALEIKECAATRGLSIGNTSNGTSVAAITSLQKVYARGGFVGLARLFDTITLSWDAETERRFAGDIVLGIDLFYEENPKADMLRLAEKLAATTPTSIKAKAQQRWHGYQAIGNAHKSLKSCVADEIQKVYRKRAA